MSDHLQQLQNEISELREKLGRKEIEMRSIQQIGNSLSSELNRDRLLILIMDELTKLMNAERSTLYIVDTEKGELWSKIAQKAEIKEIHLNIGVGIAGNVAATGEIVNIKDAYQDDRFDPTTDKKTGYHTRSILCMPIREPKSGDKKKGEIIGVLQILNKKDGVFTEADEDLLKSLASQISISLVNSRLYTTLETKVNELNLLFNTEKEISATDELTALLTTLIAMTSKSLNAGRGLMLLSEQGDNQFSLRFGHNCDQKLLAGITISHDDPLIQNLIESKNSYSCKKAAEDGVFKQSFLAAIKPAFDHFVAVPLLSEDSINGMIVLADKPDAHGYFSEDDLKIIESLASRISRGVDTIRLKQEKVKAERLSTIGNMMSTIVHDLRTPMNNIYGFVDLMSEEDDVETREEYAGIINEQIKILTNMTTDILDFAKGKTTILPHKYPVNKLIDNFVKYFEGEIRRKGFEFEAANNTAAMIYIDHEKVLRVFMNIMKNALEAMGKKGKFSITADDENDWIVFRLSDTGEGIPDEIKDRLFDSFVTSGKEGGTGLGLAIVKKVVDEHKGKIEVESEKGKGTTFKISFPKVK